MFGCGIHKVSSKESGNNRETLLQEERPKIQEDCFFTIDYGPPVQGVGRSETWFRHILCSCVLEQEFLDYRKFPSFT